MRCFMLVFLLVSTVVSQRYHARSYEGPKSIPNKISGSKGDHVKSGSGSSAYAAVSGAANAISDTVSSAFSWDPAGLLRTEDTTSADLDASSNAKYSNRRRRKNKRRKIKRKNRYKGRDDYRYDYYDDEDDEYYDRDDGYNAPSSGYSAPSSGYDAPSYSAPSYSAPSTGYGAPSYSAPTYGGGGGDGGFVDFLNALAAFLPIALFLAAIPPNLITVNTGTGRKKRDVMDNEVEEYIFPFVQKIMELGMDNVYKDKECQRKLFCEISTFGSNDGSNSVQRAFNLIANQSPGVVSKFLGAEIIFEAVKSGQCDIFKCKK